MATAPTAVGTAFKGSLVDVDALELGTKAVAEVVRRSGIDPELVDDVVLGESRYGGGDIARYAAIEAGLGHVPGLAHNRHCASGLAAADRRGLDPGRHGPRRHRRRRGVELDLPACEPPGAGHRRGEDVLAVAQPPRDPRRAERGHVDHRRLERRGRRPASPARRWTRGRSARTSEPSPRSTPGSFVEEIFPIEVTGRDGTTRTFEVDEHPRRGSTLEKLASLKPIHPEIEGFSITAGNAAGVNDGAAAMVIDRPGLRRGSTASSRWPSCGRGRRSACRPAAPGWPRPSPSPRRSTGRPRGRRHRPVGDQRGLRLDVRRRHARSSASTRRSSTSRAAAAASATRSP